MRFKRYPWEKRGVNGEYGVVDKLRRDERQEAINAELEVPNKS